MRPNVRAFTLTELLVVAAILAILAAVLSPVFRSARGVAERTHCAANFRSAMQATHLYLADYDDRFMPVSYHPGEPADPARDRTWVQVLMPYVRSFGVFRCPSDTTPRSPSDAVFDQDLVPGDTLSRFYRASKRTNLGYNYLYFSPVTLGPTGWQVMPRNVSEIANLARALVFVDSVKARGGSGQPEGGGSFVVVPPCRYQNEAGRRIDTFGLGYGAVVYAPNPGWRPSDPLSPYQFGLAWPWHNGRASVVRFDGTTAAMTVEQLAEGCDVRDNWEGNILDADRYLWDLR
ncbi:MAG: prepilin-type N-terminal cleavage/methylation domain-containing protein [Fimbriimonadaceae bacterium]